MYPDLDPKIEEINKLLSQIDILQQNLIKLLSRDTLICDNVLGSGSPTPPGVEFWRIKIRFYPPGHRKMKKEQQDRMPAHYLLCKNADSEKNKDSRLTV